MDFWQLLKEAREDAGLSLVKLEKLSGVPDTTISGYEHGVKPTLNQADKLLRALGLSLTLGVQMSEED